MRIGILTYHAAYNFGANLQALSTFMYLRKTGHEPVVIDFFPFCLEKAFEKSVPAVQANTHKSFLNKYFVLTKKCRNATDVANEIVSNNIEAVIIGSDAVIQHFPLLSRININPSRKKIVSFRIEPVHYETNFPNPFWGEFIEYLDLKVPVAMMSVSCQNTDYRLFTGKEKRSMKNLTGKIRYVTVRDKRTQELFKYISNGSTIPVVTPDPVFAFNDNVTEIPGKEEILRKFGLPDKYILLSFNSSKTVSETWIISFASIAEKNGYKCVALAMPGGIGFNNALKSKVDIPLDPLDWYSIIKYSSAYVGEKMHPVIVSLHNIVPFFSFDHYGILKFKVFLNQKASKIYQILEMADLSDYRHPIAKRFNYNAPAPEFVFEKIDQFNKGKCIFFADQMRVEYKTMMEDLIHHLQT